MSSEPRQKLNEWIAHKLVFTFVSSFFGATKPKQWNFPRILMAHCEQPCWTRIEHLNRAYMFPSVCIVCARAHFAYTVLALAPDEL